MNVFPDDSWGRAWVLASALLTGVCCGGALGRWMHRRDDARPKLPPWVAHAAFLLCVTLSYFIYWLCWKQGPTPLALK
jgi:hypothetical protein